MEVRESACRVRGYVAMKRPHERVDMEIKKVYLIGAGPGRVDLITVRGMKILGEADTVVYDYLVDPGMLKYAKEGAELVCRDQKGAGRLLVKRALEGKKAIRLKSGDPSIFARTREELASLARNGIAFEIVPGVTAGSAASSFAGIPLTDRKFASSCVFVTGREASGKNKSSIDWGSLAKCGTLILYMAVGGLDGIVKKLLKAGKPGKTPVAVIQDASALSQKILRSRLDKLARTAKKNNVKPPAIIVIGEVAGIEKDLTRFKRSKRALFTGLSEERYFEDKSYFHLPLIKIEPLKDYSHFDRCIRNIGKFDWIVFASRFGVLYFFKRLKEVGLDARALHGVNIACVGNSTANRLLDFGVLADLVPKDESSKGLIEKFKNIDLKGKKIFLPRSDISDKGLGKALENLGAICATSIAYKNVMPRGLPELDLKFFDEIIFTSPSTVRNFKKRYGKLTKRIKVRCIGGVTLKEAKRCKFVA